MGVKKIIQIEGLNSSYSLEVDIEDLGDFCGRLASNDFLVIKDISGKEFIIRTANVVIIGDEYKEVKR